MSNKKMQVAPETPRYRSGVAARLTGVPVETLRVWERRYGVVGPRLSEGGQRLYSSEDVQRLGTIKQLVDAGHAIGNVATLAIETLSEMIDLEKNVLSFQKPARHPLGADVHIALIGPWISSKKISEALSHSTIKVIAQCVEVSKAAQELEGITADIVVIESPVLNETTINVINRVKDACKASKGIIFYRFSPSTILLELRAAGYEILHKPLDSVEVEWFCNALMRLPTPQSRSRALVPTTEAPPPPRFDEVGLAALAGANSALYCECPRHLAELVLSLASFEKYSADCANRDSKDAALHRDLQWATGHARATLEDALVRLAQADGIEIPIRTQEPS